MQAWWLLPIDPPEAQDYADLIRIDAEGKDKEHNYSRDHYHQQEGKRARQARAPRHHLLELALAALQQFFEVRWTTSSTPPATATIAPRHGLVLSVARLRE